LDDYGAAGDTFEALFGLKQNNNPAADFHRFEFKTRTIKQPELKGEYANTNERNKQLELKKCANTNTRGYIHLFSFAPTIKFQSGDVIDYSYYFVDGQNGYLYEELKRKFEQKLTYLVFVTCQTKNDTEIGRLFHYDTMKIYSCTDFATFRRLLNNKTIKIEDDFLITENHLERLYRKVETIYGTTLPDKDYISFYPAADIKSLRYFDNYRFIRKGVRSDSEAGNNRFGDYASLEKIDESALPKGDFPSLNRLKFQSF